MACFQNFTLVDVSDEEGRLVHHSCMIIETGRITQLGGDELHQKWDGKASDIGELKAQNPTYARTFCVLLNILRYATLQLIFRGTS